jgi:hypothetical protein
MLFITDCKEIAAGKRWPAPIQQFLGLSAEKVPKRLYFVNKVKTSAIKNLQYKQKIDTI